MKKVLLLLLILFGQQTLFSEPVEECAGPLLNAIFILESEPIKLPTINNDKIGVIYSFKVENSKRSFDLFIDLQKFSKIKFIKGARYEISMLHNCLDNAKGYKILFGKNYDHTNLTIYIRTPKVGSKN